MTPEQQAIIALWTVLTAVCGYAGRYLMSELKDCRKECRDDRIASTASINGLTDALKKTLEKPER
jgi:hypothetical protein